MLHPNEPLLVSADIEFLLIQYLQERLEEFSELPFTQGVEVSIMVDEERPKSPQNLVVVNAVDGGGSIERFGTDSPVIITSYSTSRENAFNLANLIEGLIHQAPLRIADIYFTAALGSPVVDEEDNSDRVFSRFQNFIIRSKKQAL